MESASRVDTIDTIAEGAGVGVLNIPEVTIIRSRNVLSKDLYDL